MLHKIIYKNFKSNIRKYILFFVSNIIAVAELFIFWGLNDVVVRAVTEPSIMMGIKSDFMIAVGLITVVTILLMVFSMRYYIKLRAKDYGTFIMLGVYDLSNCPIPDYPNCLETAQSCVHNSSF